MKRRDLIALSVTALLPAAVARSGHAQPLGEASSDVSIEYDLGQDGWSSFALRVGDKSTDIGTFSYLTDALGDLVRTALLVATSATRAEFRLDGEPFEWRIILDEGWLPSMRLRILTFPDSLARAPEAQGIVDFEARVRPDDFARAVQKAARGIWNTYGATGYQKAWNGPKGFPLRALTALDAALATQEPTILP